MLMLPTTTMGLPEFKVHLKVISEESHCFERARLQSRHKFSHCNAALAAEAALDS